MTQRVKLRSAVPYVIKRYSNRKLYDPQSSKYVTLDDLKQLIRDGSELRVEDAATGEDLTSLTLAQVLLEGERTHQNALPPNVLHQLIQHGEAWYDFVQSQWAILGGLRPPAPPQPDAPVNNGTPPPTPAPLEEEIAALKNQLLALEKRMRTDEAEKPAKRRPRTGRSRAPRGSGRRS